jgi:hypothetical protein
MVVSLKQHEVAQIALYLGLSDIQAGCFGVYERLFVERRGEAKLILKVERIRQIIIDLGKLLLVVRYKEARARRAIEALCLLVIVAPKVDIAQVLFDLAGR